ncbi:MAG: alpha/beta hydrolase [Chloroflexota bacterium]|nr:alpha/beta hydrolase [Chloroflexota bacterium]
MNKAQIRAGDGDQAADEDRAVTEAWTPRATPRDRFVDANGLTFHYLDWDSPRAAAGPPIVLLHGLRDQAHEWDPIVPDLTAHGRVLALDQRGHGGSARPPGGYAPEDFAADLAAVCAALDLDRPIVIGHSLGGRTAHQFAARWPDRLRALVLVDIGAAGAPHTIPAMTAHLRATAGPFADEAEALRALIGADLRPNGALLAYARHNLRPTTDGLLTWRYDLDAAIETVRLGRARDHWDVVARIRVPTLLVRGERSDVLSREEAARLARVIPRCTLVEIAGAGHLVPQARPRELAAAIAAWRAGLDQS